MPQVLVSSIFLQVIPTPCTATIVSVYQYSKQLPVRHIQKYSYICRKIDRALSIFYYRTAFQIGCRGWPCLWIAIFNALDTGGHSYDLEKYPGEPCDLMSCSAAGPAATCLRNPRSEPRNSEPRYCILSRGGSDILNEPLAQSSLSFLPTDTPRVNHSTSSFRRRCVCWKVGRRSYHNALSNV